MDFEIKKVNIKLYDVLYTSGVLLKRTVVHLALFQLMNILLNIALTFVLGGLSNVVGSWLSNVSLVIIFFFNTVYYAGVWPYFNNGVERDKFQLDELAKGFKKVKSIAFYSVIIALLFTPFVLFVIVVFPAEIFQNPEAFLGSEGQAQAFAEQYGHLIFFLLMLAAILLLFLFYGLPLIMVGNLSAIKAIKTSFRFVFKNFLMLFSLFFTVMFFSLLLVSVLSGVMGNNVFFAYLLQIVVFVFLQSFSFALFYHTTLKLKEIEE